MRTTIALIALLLSACAVTPPQPPVDPQVTFHSKSVAEIQTMLIGLCAQGKMIVSGQTPNMLTCEREIDPTFLYSLLSDADPNTKPTAIIQFIVTPDGENAQVHWTMSVRSQRRNGNVNTQVQNSNALNSQMKDGLIGLGAQ